MRLAHIEKKNPGSGLDRAGERYFRLEQCNVINNNFPVAAQA
jgi:hypothetical protein